MNRLPFIVGCLLFLSSVARADFLSAASLQALIDAAEPGAEIMVPAGTYAGVVHLRDGLTLRGAGDDVTIIDGQGAAQVVTLGKNAALIGFTVRGGAMLVGNAGNFAGVFECTLTGYSSFALAFQGGSGVAAHNRIEGSAGRTGILCANANPAIVNNLISGNQNGVQIHPHLIPVIADNLFRDNVMAVHIVGDSRAVIERNHFDGNQQVVSSGELADGNVVGPEDTGEFVLVRGADTAGYHALMREAFGTAVKDHPIVIYDLRDDVGSFDVIGLFPWATFSLAASTLDTTIQSYNAYDIVNDQPLHAAYELMNGDRPSVRVHNPDLLEKMRERYVLENHYVHAPSYFDQPDGRRVFKRHTNVSQMEIVLPAGYRLVSSVPEGVLQAGFDRPYLIIRDVGDTYIEVVLEPVR